MSNLFQVEELWHSMCQTAITLISKALHEVTNAEVLLKIKGIIALFIQTMDVSNRTVLAIYWCSESSVMELSGQSARFILACFI